MALFDPWCRRGCRRKLSLTGMCKRGRLWSSLVQFANLAVESALVVENCHQNVVMSTYCV